MPKAAHIPAHGHGPMLVSVVNGAMRLICLPCPMFHPHKTLGGLWSFCLWLTVRLTLAAGFRFKKIEREIISRICTSYNCLALVWEKLLYLLHLEMPVLYFSGIEPKLVEAGPELVAPLFFWAGNVISAHNGTLELSPAADGGKTTTINLSPWQSEPLEVV